MELELDAAKYHTIRFQIQISRSRFRWLVIMSPSGTLLLITILVSGRQLSAPKQSFNGPESTFSKGSNRHLGNIRYWKQALSDRFPSTWKTRQCFPILTNVCARSTS